MPLRDPRNKSRNNASRRTTSATRSTRSKSSAKYNPKPSSAAQRSGKKGSAASKVTTGKGGKISSPRLKQALDSVKTKRTPAKTPPKATAAGNARVVAEAFKKTLKQRVALDKLEKAKQGTKGTGVRTAKGSKPVQTRPDSNPAKRGAAGPRQAPQQGPYRKPPSAMQGNTGRTGGTPTKRVDNQPPTRTPPKSATPKVSRVGPQTRQAKAVQAANPGRAARAARRGGKGSGATKGMLASGLVAAAASGALRNPISRAKDKARKAKAAKSVGKYNTRDADGTVRSRLRVGPKIVGPKKVGAKKVGTAEQAFDKAYAQAKKAGKKSFTFDGKKYSTK